MFRSGVGTRRFRLPIACRHARAEANSGCENLPLASVATLYLGVTSPASDREKMADFLEFCNKIWH